MDFKGEDCREVLYLLICKVKAKLRTYTCVCFSEIYKNEGLEVISIGVLP